MAVQTRDTFLECLQQSGIVSQDALGQIFSRSDLPEGSKPLAKALIQEGVITHFQADQLLQGRWKNFLFANKYQVLERIGTGATGQVYVCEHLTMKRLVAIKVLPKTYLDNPAVLERFYREGRISGNLEHANIVRSYDSGMSGRHHYLVMEYIFGNTLQRIIDKSGPFDIHRAAQYIYQAAVGLQHIHEAGLIHRDIKPSNLLLDQNGTVKILDLGLARGTSDHYDNITARYEPTAILGTADFLSPEQGRRSSEVDIRSDIYSLGITWYYLLAGASPFAEGKSVNAKLMMHQLQDPEPIGKLRPDVPEEMAAILHRMIEKDVVDRYQLPKDLVSDLADWTNVPVLPPDDDELPKVCPALGRRLFPEAQMRRHSHPVKRPKISLKSPSRPRPRAQDTIPTHMDTAKAPCRKPSPDSKPKPVEAPETETTASRQESAKPSRKPIPRQAPRRPREKKAANRRHQPATRAQLELEDPSRRRNREPSGGSRLGRVLGWTALLAVLATAAGFLTTGYRAASPTKDGNEQQVTPEKPEK